MQPVTHCILLDLLCKTKTFWVFLRSFLLFPPFSSQNSSSSSYFSLLLVMILSAQQLIQPVLQSLLLYWLGVKLNIFLCTFLLNKDLGRSALCAFVSLHTPSLFFCSNRKSVALEPALSKTLGSSLLLKAKGALPWALLEPEFYVKFL